MSRPSLEGRLLYLCTPDRPDLDDFVAACIAGGVDVVQLREKQLDDRALIARGEVLAATCQAHGVPFLVNDRADVAVACGADGVHVGQDDVPAAVARRIVGESGLVGLSTHAPEQLAAAAGEPVDYVSCGPVAPTPTKPGRPGTGLGYVRHAADRSPFPFFVTGGADPATVPQMAEAGARRFVAVRWLTESPDPEQAARRLRSAIEQSIRSLGPPGRR